MLASVFLLISLMAAQENTPAPAPDVDEVIAAMMQKDAERRAAFEGYSGIRTYVLENAEHHKRAEMTVRVICHRDGAKEFRGSFRDRLGRRTEARVPETSRGRGCRIEARKRRRLRRNARKLLLPHDRNRADPRPRGLRDRNDSEAAEEISGTRNDLGRRRRLRHPAHRGFPREELRPFSSGPCSSPTRTRRTDRFGCRPPMYP